MLVACGRMRPRSQCTLSVGANKSLTSFGNEATGGTVVIGPDKIKAEEDRRSLHQAPTISVNEESCEEPRASICN